MLKTTVKETDDQTDRSNKDIGRRKNKENMKRKEMKIKESAKEESKST